MISAAVFTVLAQTNTPSTNDLFNSFAMRAENHYRATEKRFENEPDNNEAAWRFARAAFDYAEFARNDEQKEAIANRGIQACRKVVSRDRTNAAGHYYLAMNIAQVARTKLLGALKLVGEMEREFKTALSLDQAIDYAGPDRYLGLLYRDAPGWPVSIGNHSKAKHHLERAVQLAPSYPENHLNLLDSYISWNDRTNLRKELKKTEELWPKAKAEFTGDDWEPYWADWEQRWKKIKEDAASLLKKYSSPADRN